ncbi:hypothetical protein KCU97_g14, partial [Aureobasidium melanogenum]
MVTESLAVSNMVSSCILRLLKYANHSKARRKSGESQSTGMRRFVGSGKYLQLELPSETLLLTVLANPGAATSDDLALDLAKLLESTCVRVMLYRSEVSRNQEQSQTTARD